MTYSRNALFLYTALGAGLLLTPACTGLTLGENEPGGSLGTYLEDGSIAVDPRTERIYVLRRLTDTRGETPVVQKELFTLDPDTLVARRLADVSDLDDLRLAFPNGQVLLFGERDGLDRLRALDPQTGDFLREIPTDARYHGLRLSPSGRFVVVADNADPEVPIHLIDTETYEIVTLPHDGTWLEAMWGNERDLLVAMVEYDEGVGAEGADGDRMRLMGWDVRALSDNDWPREGAFWADPIFDVSVDGVRPDFAFSHSWVGVSPDDTSAVFPVRAYRPEDPASAGPQVFENRDWKADLLVVDVPTGTLRRVANAHGPVGFSPDGSTIVSYGYTERPAPGGRAYDPDLILIDAMTLETERRPIPFEGLPSFFVTRTGHQVVIAEVFGTEELALYDLESGEMTRVPGAHVALDEFVSRPGRPELWIADNRQLHRLDLMTSTLEPIPLTRAVDRINILPARDRLVLGDRDGLSISIFDPSTRQELGEVIFPRPLTVHHELGCAESWCVEDLPQVER